MRILPLMVLCLGFAASWSCATAGDDLSLATAINKAGSQRMLSQAIVRTYCQFGLDVLPELSREQLDEAVRRFDTQLAELAAFAPNDQVRYGLADVQRIWQPFKTIANGPVTRAGAKLLIYWDGDLLHASHKVVRLLQDSSDTSFARLVNISGRQRMLSQRLAKFYMMLAWGFDTLSIRDEMERARIEFAGGLAVLQAAPETTTEIARELDDVAVQWMWFENALNLHGEEAFRLVVADASDSILSRMDRITKMYEEAFSR